MKALLRLHGLMTMHTCNMRYVPRALVNVRRHCSPAQLQQQQRNEQSEQSGTHSKIVVVPPEKLHCQ